MFRPSPHFVSNLTLPLLILLCLFSNIATALSSPVTVVYSDGCARLLWYPQRVALLFSLSISLLSTECFSFVMSLEMFDCFLEL